MVNAPHALHHRPVVATSAVLRAAIVAVLNLASVVSEMPPGEEIIVHESVIVHPLLRVISPQYAAVPILHALLVCMTLVKKIANQAAVHPHQAAVLLVPVIVIPRLLQAAAHLLQVAHLKTLIMCGV